MGRLILISGANDSGKSAFAERMIGLTTGQRYYIATMIPQTEDNFIRIAKHRKQRETFQFHTLELAYRIGTAPVTTDSAVLLEDVSNLLANAMFEAAGTPETVFTDICTLSRRCAWLAAVTISGFSEAHYQGETANYLHALNRLNAMLSSAADIAVVMSHGIPHVIKGSIQQEFG